MRVVSRYAEAFKEGFNLVTLASALALSAALLNPIPLLAAIVAEAAYLLFVPDSRWFEQRLEKKYDAQVLEHREKLKSEVFPHVRNSVRERFLGLESMRKQIESQVSGEEKWFRYALRKLDFLLEKYLQFAQKESTFVQYLTALKSQVQDPQKPPPVVYKKKGVAFDIESSPAGPLVEPSEKWVRKTVEEIQDHYNGEIEEIDNKLTADPDFPTRQVVEKRKEILKRRHEFVGRIGMILANLESQMALMADTFGLVNDEIRARSPEQVLADIDEVVLTTNSLTEAIESVTPYDELVAKPKPDENLGGLS
ncbi:MAG: hypothetical protein ABL949_03135 [Fimbriimonadaceae bacterium]